MSAALPSIQLSVDYTVLTQDINDFLSHFKKDEFAQTTNNEEGEQDADMTDGIGGGPKYLAILEKVANRELDSITVELDDILQFQNEKFLEGTSTNNGTCLLYTSRCV